MKSSELHRLCCWCLNGIVKKKIKLLRRFGHHMVRGRRFFRFFRLFILLYICIVRVVRFPNRELTKNLVAPSTVDSNSNKKDSKDVFYAHALYDHATNRLLERFSTSLPSRTRQLSFGNSNSWPRLIRERQLNSPRRIITSSRSPALVTRTGRYVILSELISSIESKPWLLYGQPFTNMDIFPCATLESN